MKIAQTNPSAPRCIIAKTVAATLGCTIFATINTHAATSTWQVASGNWSIGANWQGGLPNNPATSDAVINNGGTTTLNGSYGIRNFTLFNSALTASSATPLLTVNQIADLTAGTVAGATRITTATGAASGVKFTDGFALNNTSVITNNGQAGGWFTNVFNADCQVGAAQFINSSSGIFTVTGGGTLFNNAGGAATIQNAGSWVMNTPDSGLSVGWAMNNTGTINAQAGTMSLYGGGISTGIFNVGADPSANITFNGGTHTFGSGVQINGAGNTDIIAGTINLTGNSAAGSGHLRALGGNITSTTSNTLTVASIELAGGVIDGNARVISGAGASDGVKITNGFAINDTAIVTNNGQAGGWGPGVFNGDSQVGAGQLVNSATGVFTVTGGGTLFNNAGGAATIQNAGSFVINTPDSGLTVGWAMNNTGLIDVQKGTLALEGAVPQYNATTKTLTGGSWKVSTGGVLTGAGLGPIKNIGAGTKVTLSGTGNMGTLFSGTPSSNSNAGELIITGGRTQFASGTFANSGRIEAATGSQFIVTDNLTNSGTIALTGGGVQANNLFLTSSGTLMGTGTVSGAVTNNGGTLSPGNSIGTITVNNGYTQTGGTIQLELGSFASAAVQDRLVSNGGFNISLTNVVLDFSLLPGSEMLEVGDAFTVILKTGGGTFNSSNVTQDFSDPSLAPYTFQTFQTASSIQVNVVTVVPEPSTMLLLAVGSVFGVITLKHRNRSRLS